MLRVHKKFTIGGCYGEERGPQSDHDEADAEGRFHRHAEGDGHLSYFRAGAVPAGG